VKGKIYRTIISHVLLYGCEHWSFTPSKNIDCQCLRIGPLEENMDLRSSSGRLRKLHNEDEMGGICSTDERNKFALNFSRKP
jgi:hypothetical protein